ncbi:MAG: virulence protein [Candidatus Pelethousia sp.]|nr:virulence protein [Candidatus Pelethousia sp.]
MRIYYNVTGERRKSLVGAISQELNMQVKYLGAPTFAYEVGGYTIDKNGVLEGEDNSELVADLCGLHDFRAETEEYDTPLPAAVPVPEDAPIPMEAALGGRVSPYRDEEEPPAYGQPEDDEPDRRIIEIPLEGFTDTALENLDRLISSKAALIKKAIGTDALPVERTKTMLKFPWFRFGATSEEVDTYSRLVCALCAAAKEQKRVNAKEKTVENEKFAFRVFLIRLGFVGDEYKAARKTLLKGLSGNSAFKDGTPTKSTEEATANIGESGKARV